MAVYHRNTSLMFFMAIMKGNGKPISNQIGC